MRIEIDVLDKKSIAKGISDLNAYKKDMLKKADELCYKLMEMGAFVVSMSYSRSQATFVSDKGSVDYNINVSRKGNHFYLRVTGEDVLFIEFGSGASQGYGHPDAGDSEGFVTSGESAPFGPGTFPEGKGHWREPYWYTPGGHRSYGNPPGSGMYFAKKEIEENILKFAKEIFNG